jgi:hypothetical protein
VANSSCCNAAGASREHTAAAVAPGIAASGGSSSSSSSSSSKDAEQATPPALVPVQVQVSVGGMTCSMCAGAVEDVLKKVRQPDTADGTASSSSARLATQNGQQHPPLHSK